MLYAVSVTAAVDQAEFIRDVLFAHIVYGFLCKKKTCCNFSVHTPSQRMINALMSLIFIVYSSAPTSVRNKLVQSGNTVGYHHVAMRNLQFFTNKIHFFSRRKNSFQN